LLLVFFLLLKVRDVAAILFPGLPVLPGRFEELLELRVGLVALKGRRRVSAGGTQREFERGVPEEHGVGRVEMEDRSKSVDRPEAQRTHVDRRHALLDGLAIAALIEIDRIED